MDWFSPLLPHCRFRLTHHLAIGLVSAGILSVAVTGGLGCASETVESLDHVSLRAEWDRWVIDRDSFFLSSQSPLPTAAKDSFAGLPYFTYDTTLAVPGALQPALGQDTVYFPTTTGELRPMATVGRLTFRSQGKEHRLRAYLPLTTPSAETTERTLFIPFRDRTSGGNTYAGGRYLDVPVSSTGRYTINFNEAYHPYCVYDASYSCPLPPSENTLDLEVTAGERLPEGYTPAAAAGRQPTTQ